jgi:multidrug efflux pump subunit AcrA (membrane-fusion protein)
MKDTPPMTFAGLLAQRSGDPDTRAEFALQTRRVLLPLAVVAGLVALWSAAAPLSGAVIANGQLKVELNRKTVQHQEGGIVREILVRDGQRVRAGQPLVVVGDVRSDSELSLLQDQLRAARMRGTRAEVEAALQTRFVAPRDVAGHPEAASHFAREHTLFTARRRTLDEQVVALEKQIREAHAQAGALASQIAATENSARLSAEELEINNRLVREGFISRTRLWSCNAELRIIRPRSENTEASSPSRTNVSATWKRVSRKHATSTSNRLPTSSRMRPPRCVSWRSGCARRAIRSNGRSCARRWTAKSCRCMCPLVGEVLGPRQPILDVVPENEKLVVEARIHPQDIDHVHRDAPAEVRLSAFDARTIPLLPAKVLFISPDRVTQPDTKESWFVATIEVDGASLKNYPQVHLHAGMPAELFVTTPDRTLFQYLTKPLRSFADRAMREP